MGKIRIKRVKEILEDMGIYEGQYNPEKFDSYLREFGLTGEKEILTALNLANEIIDEALKDKEIV